MRFHIDFEPDAKTLDVDQNFKRLHSKCTHVELEASDTFGVNTP